MYCFNLVLILNFFILFDDFAKLCMSLTIAYLIYRQYVQQKLNALNTDFMTFALDNMEIICQRLDELERNIK